MEVESGIKFGHPCNPSYVSRGQQTQDPPVLASYMFELLEFITLPGRSVVLEHKNQKSEHTSKRKAKLKNNLLISGHAYLFCPIISSLNCSSFSEQ